MDKVSKDVTQLGHCRITESCWFQLSQPDSFPRGRQVGASTASARWITKAGLTSTLDTRINTLYPLQQYAPLPDMYSGEQVCIRSHVVVGCAGLRFTIAMGHYPKNSVTMPYYQSRIASYSKLMLWNTLPKVYISRKYTP